MKQPEIKTHVGKKAQSMVEFALTIPIFLVMMLGVIEAGRLMYIYTILTAAGREAARYGAGIASLTSSPSTPLYNDCDGIKAAAIRIGSFAGIIPSDIHIYHDTGPDTASTEYCTSTSPTATFGTNDRITVKISMSFSPIVPLVNLPSFPLQSNNSHTILMGAKVAVTPPAISGGGGTCDVSSYKIASQSNKLGPTDTVTIQNNSGAATSIVNVLIIWDTTSGAVLNSVSGIPGLPSPLNNAGPAFSTGTINWSFPPGNTSFTVYFSKTLKSSVIIRLQLSGDNNCAFGE
jgi:Flp pilus assembly protein TadG